MFFGAAAGVGKTYAMLEAAREQRADGVDVRRRARSRRTGGPRRRRCSKGSRSFPAARRVPRDRAGEFDLDAALRAAPPLMLVDELAHTNAPGSRHAKRWQDVVELLDAGIDVYTTLNVQHVESLNDIVAKITGIAVRETVPDSVFEHADEVELVDLPPDDLLERLHEGKVYMPEQAQEAVENFFRKGNLIALRELALRRTAERVDAQMRVYRREHGIGADVADGRAHPRLHRARAPRRPGWCARPSAWPTGSAPSGSRPTSRPRPSCGCRRGTRQRHADAAAGRAARRRDDHAERPDA